MSVLPTAKCVGGLSFGESVLTPARVLEAFRISESAFSFVEGVVETGGGSERPF